MDSGYVVAYAPSFAIGGDGKESTFKEVWTATVYARPADGSWPRRSKRNRLLTLVADTEEGAAEQVRLWVLSGHSTAPHTPIEVSGL